MSALPASSHPAIVFMGTPDFAVPALTALHQTYGVAAVVTVPDKHVGRGLTLRSSAVKAEAERLGIAPILQPVSLKDPEFAEQIRLLQPDILCVIAFRILPKSVYSLARLGAFNVHASLLPKYRGAAPINHALIQGENVTGVTSFLLTDVVDAGTIIQQKELAIPDGTTAGELYQQLQPLAALCAVETAAMLANGSATPLQQDEQCITLAPKVFRETSVIYWNQTATTVRNMIHGLSPTPCAWTVWNNQVLKVYRASFASAHVPAGEWLIRGLEFYAGCANGSLLLTEVQLPGKKRMPVAELLRGYRGADHGRFTTEQTDAVLG